MTFRQWLTEFFHLGPIFPSQAGPDEIIPGVTKPSTIITKMICQRIIAGDYATCRTDVTDYNRMQALGHGSRYTSYRWKDDKIEIDFTQYSYGSPCVFKVIVGGKNVELEGEQKCQIMDAIQGAAQHHYDRKAAEAKAIAELGAVDAIGYLMGLAPHAKEEVCTTKGNTRTTRKKPAVAASCSCTRAGEATCLCPA